jgi:hypothetical protein
MQSISDFFQQVGLRARTIRSSPGSGGGASRPGLALVTPAF